MPRGRPPKLSVVRHTRSSDSPVIGQRTDVASPSLSGTLISGDKVISTSGSSENLQQPDPPVIPVIPVDVPVIPVDVPVPTNATNASSKTPYVQALKSSSKGMSLSYVRECFAKEVVIDVDDIVDEMDYWSCTLVGTVMGRKTSIGELNTLVLKHWNHVSSPEILYFSRGWFYFRFQSKEDMKNIQSEAWNVNGFPLVFKAWSPTVAEELEVVTHVPVWVLFPNLDPCFWSSSALSKVSSFVGKPVCADETTTNKSKIAFARILIEVDISKELPRCMVLQTPFRDKIWQKIDYEWVPYFCTTCHKIGHTQDRCKKKVQQVYRPKVVVPAPTVSAPVQGPLIDSEGFITVPARKAAKAIQQDIPISRVENSYAMLDIAPVLLQLDVEDGQVHVGFEFGSIPVEMEPVKRKLFQSYSLVTNLASHPGGRLWVLWNPATVTLRVLHTGAQFLHCSLLHNTTQRSVLVTFVYAFNRASERLDLWDQLRAFSSVILPWICLDHPYTGGIFTWHNKQDSCPKWAKHDRLLANQSWFLHVPSTVAFIPAGVSDHASILLTVASPAVLHRPFRYLNCWSLSTGFSEIVRSAWQVPVHGGHIFSLFSKLRNLRWSLKSIHVAEFRGLTKRVADAKVRLSECQSLLYDYPVNQLLLAQEKALMQTYKALKNAEMRMLAQKAKVQHLQLSDANTKYFYASIAARKTRNTIGAIDDMHGQLCHGHDKVTSAFMEFYTNLLGSTEEVVSPPTDLFSCNILQHPDHLNADVSVYEIQSALSSIDRNKSPRIDGFSSGFFKDSWATTGQDFVAAVQEFFSEGCYA
ncbi:hypothetical protein RND81_14G206500 [Saponaria officinalis]|uniref:DUF4283 domain-containing protein n=1 Tax=Saponaria officinalis TaxID=3572 RepID=A0AAW1GSU2_SAPOF